MREADPVKNAAPDLFSHADRVETARQMRDAGMSLAAFAQDQKSPGWGDLAYAAIRDIAARQETVHVDDVLTEFSLPPHHPNAWGGVWMRAIRNGVIERTGTVRHCRTDIGKHSHLYPVYRSKLWRPS